AKAAFALPEEKLNLATLRQDQRNLSSSMRRLTAVVSIVAIAMAVGVFLFFPRGSGQGMLTPIQFRPAQTLTGFNDQVNFDQVASLNPTGTHATFTLAGPASIIPKREMRIRIGADQALLSEDPLFQPFDYEVLSSNVVEDPSPSFGRSRGQRRSFGGYAFAGG